MMALIRFSSGCARDESTHHVARTSYLRAFVDERAGQSTVEYVLVFSAISCIACALAALWHFSAQGQLAQLSQEAASHLVEQFAGIRDIVLF